MFKKVKSKVREEFLKRRRHFARENDISEISLAICRKTLDYIKRKGYERVAIYYEVHEEVCTEFLDQNIERTYYPKIKGNNIHFVEYNRGDLRGMPTNKWDIPEPIGNFVSLKEIDCVVVPGVAFDQDLNRLGYGGGFYDRALCHYDGDIIGMAYDFQVVERIPFVPYDVPVRALFTEKRDFNGD